MEPVSSHYYDRNQNGGITDQARELVAQHTERGIVQTEALVESFVKIADVTPERAGDVYRAVSENLVVIDVVHFEQGVAAAYDARAKAAKNQSNEGVGSFLEGAFAGDFSGNDSWSRTAGQVVVGFIPIVGQVADARDTAASVGQVWRGEEGGWLNLGAAAVGWIPGIGDGIKASIRGADKLVTETAQTAVKRGDINKPEFIGSLRGADVSLPGVTTRAVEYTKRLPEDTAELRKAFNSTERRAFLQDLASDPNKVEQLREAGLSDTDITRIIDGKVPREWQVHHKLPIDDGGDNSFDNLLLIKNEPAHKVITNAQKELTGDLAPGQTKLIDFPVPNGFVYPPRPDLVTSP